MQTPHSAGNGFGASVLVAGLMLASFSLASFAASKAVSRASRRASPELIVVAGCMALIASMALFRLARGGYWQIEIAMAVDGFGAGCVYAVNPLQITGGVPPAETGSAMSFYQLAGTAILAAALAVSLLFAMVASNPGSWGAPGQSG